MINPNVIQKQLMREEFTAKFKEIYGEHLKALRSELVKFQSAYAYAPEFQLLIRIHPDREPVVMARPVVDKGTNFSESESIHESSLEIREDGSECS